MACFSPVHRSRLLAALAIFLFVFSASSAARAERALDLEESGLRLALDTDAAGNWYTLSIRSTANKPVAPEVFALENPPRLVVDVPGFPVKTARQSAVNSQRIAALRIGVHPGKMRLVFDLSGTQVPSFSSSDDGGTSAALVTLNFGSAARQPLVPQQETPPDMRPPESAPEVVGEPVVIAPPRSSVKAASSAPAPVESEEFEDLTPDQVAALNATEDLSPAHHSSAEPLEITPPPVSSASSSSERSVEHVASSAPPVLEVAPKSASVASSEPAPEPATQSPPVITGRSVVKGIFFKSTPEYGPSLVVSVDSLGKYSLAKKQENLFELLLENAQFAGPFLELPQFSPDTFDGLDVLVAEKRGNDIAVKIYTGEGIRLAPFRIKGELWIRIVK